MVVINFIMVVGDGLVLKFGKEVSCTKKTLRKCKDSGVKVAEKIMVAPLLTCFQFHILFGLKELSL